MQNIPTLFKTLLVLEMSNSYIYIASFLICVYRRSHRPLLEVPRRGGGGGVGDLCRPTDEQYSRHKYTQDGLNYRKGIFLA